MKRFVLSGLIFLGLNSLSFAAPPTPVFDWTGFYVGGNVGYGWGNRDIVFVGHDPSPVSIIGLGGTPPPISFKSSGALGGLQIGYNFRTNRSWLVGIEADFDLSGLTGSGTSAGIINAVAPYTQSADEHLKWFGTLRLRAGYLPTDSFLLFITGGLAYGQVKHSGSFFNGPFTIGTAGVLCFPGETCFLGSSSGVTGGWTIGAGAEYLVLQRITFKLEYLYVSLGANSFNESALNVGIVGVGPANIDANYRRTNFNVFRAGFNFHF
jgi:outer membrane immunogenic protein